MTELLTHHCIDDLPVTAPEAIGIFKLNFPLIPARQTVADESRIAFNIHRKSVAEAFLRDAERIIKCFNLPLEASLYTGALYATLNIEFKRI
jgi:hypothetical protein